MAYSHETTARHGEGAIYELEPAIIPTTALLGWGEKTRQGKKYENYL